MQQTLCALDGVHGSLCSEHVARQCANLTRALASAPSVFEPWGVERSRYGWRYHICGAVPRRTKSWAGVRLEACGEGQPLVGQCRVPVESSVPGGARMLPPLLPAVRTLLEAQANRIRKKLSALARGEGRCFVTDFGAMPMAARYLLSGLRRQSCAVVGNAPALNERARGSDIDAHDVVFRFNFAPTRGYERQVLPLASPHCPRASYPLRGTHMSRGREGLLPMRRARLAPRRRCA